MEPCKEVKFENLGVDIKIELHNIDKEIKDNSQEYENMIKVEHDLVKIENNLEDEITNAEYQNKIKLENNAISMRTTAVPVPNSGHVENYNHYIKTYIL